jgi:phage-related protein
MTTFTYTPSFEAVEISEPKVHEFRAGDGYENRIRFGLNTDPKQWELTFSERTNTERDAILAFFEARGGVTSFDWTSPRSITGKYVCKKWRLTMRSYNFNTIQATFEQKFEP